MHPTPRPDSRRTPTRSPLLACLLAATACGGSGPSTAPDPEPEVPRLEVQLLVERISRSGTRSWVAMGLDGSFVAPLAGMPPDAVRVVPAPDGRTLALIRASQDLLHLWVMDRDGMNARPLLEGVRVVEHVAWSPDGRRLALESSTLDDTADVWVLNADGTGATNLTPDPKPAVVYDRSPAWSPDGSRIAFSSNRTGTTRLWTMRADGTDPVQVVPSSVAGAERAPAWSPDGSLIAFVADTPEGPGIGVARPDGSGYRVHPRLADADNPAWLPDGRLVFSDRATGDFEVHALDLASGATTNLTRHRDHDVRAAVLRHAAPPEWLGFAPPARYAVRQASAPGIAAGDFDADGFADLAVLSPAVPEVQLLRGTAAGTFLPFGTLEGGASGLAIASANVSLDPGTDIVVLGPAAFSVYRGGVAGPGLPTEHSLPGEARGLAVRDLDANGIADVAVVVDRPGSGFHLEVFSANGDDVIGPILDAATDFTDVGQICAGDVTGEGADDLVVVTAGVAPLLLFSGRGDITFDAPVVAATGLQADRRTLPICADLDGDGRSDVALLQPGQQPRGLSVHAWRGTAFGPATRLEVSGDAVGAADFDRDGDVDLVVASGAARSLLFLRNRGDGRFAKAVPVALGSTPARLLVADLDGDTWPDVAATDAEGSVVVLRNLRRDPAAGGQAGPPGGG